ncbi:MAG: YlxR family protein [Candidatus Peregrinibacteria bacterium]
MNNLSQTFRQCAITKKMLPRTKLFRLVRTKEGAVFFDQDYTIAGRGIHFSKPPEVVEQFFSPQKRKMVAHFLKAELFPEQMETLKGGVKETFQSLFLAVA